MRRSDGALTGSPLRAGYRLLTATGGDVGWPLALAIAPACAAMELVVLYAEFAGKAHLGYGQMAGLGILILTPPTLCLLVGASYLLVRGWATVDATLTARAAGTRLRPGAAFRGANTSSANLHTFLLVLAAFVAVSLTAVHPEWLVLHPLTSRLLETAGPVLLTTCTFHRMTRVPAVPAAVTLGVTLLVAVVVSALTVTTDRLPPAQPLMTTTTALVMVVVTVFAQASAAARTIAAADTHT